MRLSTKGRADDADRPVPGRSRVAGGDARSGAGTLKDFELHRPRQWGACWLALDLWEQLQLDAFWQGRLPPSRKGTSWLNVLKTLSCYRLIDPGSEWRLHRQWWDRSAIGDLLGEDAGLAESHKLYRCLDKLVEHKEALSPT